jgi:hypothetical protein
MKWCEINAKWLEWSWNQCEIKVKSNEIEVKSKQSKNEVKSEISVNPSPSPNLLSSFSWRYRYIYMYIHVCGYEKKSLGNIVSSGIVTKRSWENPVLQTTGKRICRAGKTNSWTCATNKKITTRPITIYIYIYMYIIFQYFEPAVFWASL